MGRVEERKLRRPPEGWSVIRSLAARRHAEELLYFAALTVFLAGAALVAVVFLAAAGLAAVDLAASGPAQTNEQKNNRRHVSDHEKK